jgi:phage terminase small subunit
MSHRERVTAAPLTSKQARFVSEYLIDHNATQAAIRAGYSPRTAQEQSSRLLSNVMVSSAVAAGQARQLAAIDLSATRVLEELRRVAFANAGDYFDANGSAKQPHELAPPQQRRSPASKW